MKKRSDGSSGVESRPEGGSGRHGGGEGSRSKTQRLHGGYHELVENEQETSLNVAPASSKLVTLPLRPGFGRRGTKCLVRANHFVAQLPEKDLHHYHVTITPVVKSVNRAVMTQLVNLYRSTDLGKRLPAYDGGSSLYTAGPLPFTSREFKITLLDADHNSHGRGKEKQFKVVIKLASRVSLHHLEMYLRGRVLDAPQDTLKVLDIVLRELPTNQYTPVGQSFYSPRLGHAQPLGEGLESWRGFYQSMRPTQMGLSLNIDMSSTVFIEPLPVVDFVKELLHIRDDSTRPLSEYECGQIKKALKGLKVEVTHRGESRQKFRISGLTSQPTHELKFPVGERQVIMYMVDYFRETYGVSIQHVQWPCLLAGNDKRPTYLPMEVCKIVEGQRWSKGLNERQVASLLKATCQRPQQREDDILKAVRNNAYDRDSYAKEFGIEVSKNLTSVEARILPPPLLKYHETGRERDCLPKVGQWNMTNKKLVNGGRVANWMCINFAHDALNHKAHGFFLDLAKMCNANGMHFNPEPVLPVHSGRPEQCESVLKTRFNEAMRGTKQLDLIFFIIPGDNGSLYGNLKKICETDLGIVSQCCKAIYVNRRNANYLLNLALKINVKVGGRNTVLADALQRHIPNVTDVPTIIFGADISHPPTKHHSSPSIAAVVASQDWPEITKYMSLVSAQTRFEELIADLYKETCDSNGKKIYGGMIKEHLISFYRATGQRKPQRIIFYRNGVGEGRSYQVLFHELDAIRKACASMEPNYQPPVTFIEVRKRHHTRLFPGNPRDRNSVDRSGNIMPGTVVDSKICHPTEFDFYLCSHAGIQGTSRPAYYHVLWDDNKFSADGLQSLTNNLCYTYARCTRSVSIVPPAYYAHLAATRARNYLDPGTSDSGSETSGPGMDGRRSHGPASSLAVKPLPELKESVKRVMYYV